MRDFIQENYQPYDGDGAFLVPATAHTKRIWAKLNDLFVEERRSGGLQSLPGGRAQRILTVEIK